jgi:adenine-specific DNA-methyltransferase
VSRLNDLLRELRSREPALARDLEREVAALADRRAFGLNFERHVPEVVELPGRRVRKGDKVRVLPPRGQMPKKSDEKLWVVIGIERSASTATLEPLAAPAPDSGEPMVEAGEARPEPSTAALDDLVVVAEFRDPIYPGLVSTGRVERGGDRPFHTVINAENFYALETLLFTHRGKVDCIYIDPPYNSGAKDWKYNNDYVESDDLYRHSKWLAFMERRLLLAKELLNPDDSVLIVTIDEKEYLRLGLLLEQTFPEARIQMVSTIIKPEGTNRTGEFSRTNEFIYFAMVGDARVHPTIDDMTGRRDVTTERQIEWRNLRRRENTSIRSARPNQFYAVFVEESSGRLHSVGNALAQDVDRATVNAPDGCFAVFPLKPDGTEMLWGLTPGALRDLAAKGYARVANGDRSPDRATIQYLAGGTVSAIEAGNVTVAGRDDQGAVIGFFSEGSIMPKTTWNKDSHNAQTSGTLMISALLPGRRFPFPKSLYAVEDSLRFFIGKKPGATVIDFFSGSGTTAHAVMRLNKQDGGLRRSIMVTNNEVSAGDQGALRNAGLRPGDPEWEQHGICEFITKPRLAAAITGKTPDGEPINGDYKFTDEFPMADGFEENVEFFTLTYEAPLRVTSNREFARIAPLLWIRAGASGRRIDDISKGWDVADAYGVLADLDHTEDFLKAIAADDNVGIAYVVTDEDRLFESVAQELPDHVEPVRLYEAYLRNFEIESGRGSL